MPSTDDDLDFLEKSTPDQDLAKPDQRPNKTQNTPAANGRRRLAISGARDPIRTGIPFEVYDLSYSLLAIRSQLPLPLACS
jgi:hypothetical protein